MLLQMINVRVAKLNSRKMLMLQGPLTFVGNVKTSCGLTKFIYVDDNTRLVFIFKSNHTTSKKTWRYLITTETMLATLLTPKLL
jgi:hypothetical protein